MNSMDPKIIDSHVHLDILHRVNPGQIDWMKENRYVPISWSYGGKGESIEAIKVYLNRHAEFIAELNRQQTPCFYLAGVHPRCIPPDLRSHHLSDLLSPCLEDPFCLGIGEIGLETGSALEQEILSAQLELFPVVKDAGKHIGIHTPRNNKVEITEKILSLLASFSGIEPITVIDHCILETIPSILANGFHVGITMSPPKTSHEDLKNIIETHDDDLNRIMCNTDSGGFLYNDLDMFYASDTFSSRVRSQLACQTALGFFFSNT